MHIYILGFKSVLFEQPPANIFDCLLIDELISSYFKKLYFSKFYNGVFIYDCMLHRLIYIYKFQLPSLRPISHASPVSASTTVPRWGWSPPMAAPPSNQGEVT